MGNDLEAAVETSTTWTAFERLVRDAARLTERVEADPIDFLPEGYARLRRYAPRFLASFSFCASPAAKLLLTAIELLKQMNTTGAKDVPAEAPRGFVRPNFSRGRDRSPVLGARAPLRAQKRAPIRRSLDG